MKNLNNFQIEYIKEHYHNNQTWEIAEKLNLNTKQVSRCADRLKLKKDKDFVVVRKQNKLTLEQCNFIIENYENMSNKDISKKLNIKVEDIKNFASRRGLKKNPFAKDSSVYTKEQIDFIKNNYSNMNTNEISKILNIDEKVIWIIASKNGIKKDKSIKKYVNSDNGLTLKQKIFIKENYSSMKTNDICKKLNLTYSQVHSYAKNLKLKKDPYFSKQPSHYWEKCLEKHKQGYCVFDYLGKEVEPKIDIKNLYKSKYGKYHVNQNYFNKIDNEWKSYWLGFLYADGCNRITKNGKKNVNTLLLYLSSVDKSHIEKFKNSLQTDCEIHDYKTKDKEFYNSKISICNKNICEDLNLLGCTPRKSLTLDFPKDDIVPKKYLRDFIRGYFDGDGCIHINHEKRNIVLNMVGTEDFLLSVREIFKKELDINETKIVQQKGNRSYSLQYGSIISVEKIYKYLYKDCNIYLERKLNKFNTLLCLD